MTATWGGQPKAADLPNHPVGGVMRPPADVMAVVQRSAAAIRDRPIMLAEAFYRHLFILAPGLREMFPADMSAQNEKLVGALLDSIQALVEPEGYAERMERALYRLGVQHAHRHAVKPEHYPYVGHALVRAVREVADDTSASTSSAWISVYNWMTANMLGTTRW